MHRTQNEPGGAIFASFPARNLDGTDSVVLFHPDPIRHEADAMQQLTSDAQNALQNLAQRYGVSIDAVTSMLFAVSNGGGTMAQFNVPELGGSGQWMQGGMTMVGDMFNYGLQSKVSGLCSELSSLLRSQNVFLPQPQFSPQQQQYQGGGFGFPSYGSSLWPAELGQPSSSGGQNDVRYAYFPHVSRLAIDRGGNMTIYDTLDHNIGGVQQQQGGPSGTLSFSSQRGTFTVDSLPVVSGASTASQSYPPPQSAPVYTQEPAPSQQFGSVDGPRTQQEVLTALERLGDLHQKGILTDSEFQAKKSELLSRI
jgi:hypothetical protein